MQTPLPDPNNPTLGQVAQAANGAPGNAPANNTANNYLQQYEQALATTRQMIAPLKKDLAPPPGAPGLLANIATFGMAGLAHHDYMARERARDEHENQQLELAAMGAAKDMVDSHANAEALQNKSLLEQLGMELRVLQYKELVRDHEWNQFDKAQRRARDETLPPPSPGQVEAGEAMGQEYVPSAVPNRFRLRPKQSGGWEMPAAGSPMANALGTGGTAPAPSSGPQPGESPADTLARRKAEQQAKIKTTSEEATSNLELDRNAKIVEDWFNDPKFDMATAQTLFKGPGSSLAGPVSAYLQRKAGKPGIQYLGLAKTKILPALRAMEAGTKGMTLRGGRTLEQVGLTKPLEALASGSASQQEAQAFKATVLDAIQQIRGSMGAKPPGAAPTPSTASTGGQLGNARRLSSGKLIMEEP